MKISYEWLREYIPTKIRAENLASKLTMIGHEVEAIEKKGRDFIFNMEITPNRPDCLSHIGIAREVSAMVKKRLKIPSVKLKLKKSSIKPIKVEIEDTAACLRYSARIIRNVRVGPSPKWLIKRIESVGLRPVNNIVDITNFVLLETGQPLHAFDMDKLNGNEIKVRMAKQAEKITTIDGLERELKSHMLVIADKEQAVAVAGVMGGKDTEVTETTKNILLESAYFDSSVVRKTAFSLGLSTDSSYRFERGVDLLNVVAASDRASCLIRNIAKGDIGSISDVGAKNKELKNLALRAAYVNKLLGTELKNRDIKEILVLLGFRAQGTSAIEVTIPSFRSDITTEADLIEETARIYGYENITSKPPAVITTDENPLSKDIIRKRDLAKQTLLASGFNEVITYSLLSRETIKQLAFSEVGIIGIRNPLSKEQEIMRPSLLPGIIKTVSCNLSRQIQAIKIFELSNIYFVKEGAYNEEPSLALGLYDKSHKKETTPIASGLLQLKGTITLLWERLGLTELDFEKTSNPLFVIDEAIAVLSGYTMLGVIGRVKPGALDIFDIKGNLYVAELNFNKIEEASNLNRSYKTLPRYPFSYRDVSFAIDKEVSYKEIATLIKNAGGALIEEIELLSEYRGEQISKNQRGLAIRVIYRSKEKTLTEEEISRVDTAVRGNLTKTFNASLR